MPKQTRAQLIAERRTLETAISALTARSIAAENELITERSRLEKEIAALKAQIKLLERAVGMAAIVANDPPQSGAATHDRLSQLL